MNKPAKRVERKSLFQRGPQAINGERDPNFEYRFVNDIGSRIDNFKEAGYELVTDETLRVGDARVSDPSGLGNAKRSVSNDGTVSYLMRIKKEYYKEDQEAKLAVVTETEGAMHKNASSDYGTLKVSRD